MSTLHLEQSLSSVTNSEELVSAALHLLQSNLHIAPDSECALLFTQKAREITMKGIVSPMAIVAEVLALYSQGINELCCKHENQLSLDERFPDEVVDTGLLELNPLTSYLS
jgi:hypothetical protein